MIPTTGKSLKKTHEVRVTCPGRFNMELPNEAFSPLSNRFYDHCKNDVYPFSWQHLSGKHISSSKSCNLLVQTITENGVKQIKITEINLSQSCVLCQLLRTKSLASGSKCIKHFLLFLPLFDLCLLSEFDLFKMSCLS